MPLKSWQDLLDDAGGAGGDFEPLPDGDYDFVISKAEALQTKNGKTMYKVQCKVENGPNKDKTVWNNFVISPESPVALSIFFRQMNILGLGKDFWKTDPADHQVAAKLNGVRFRGQIITKSFNGQESNEIKNFYTPRATGPGPGAGPGLPATAAPSPAPAPAAAPAPAPAPAPAFAAPPPAAAPPQASPPPPPAPAPAPIQQEAAAPPPAPAAPPVEAPIAAPPAPPVPVASGDAPPPPPPF